MQPAPLTAARMDVPGVGRYGWGVASLALSVLAAGVTLVVFVGDDWSVPVVAMAVASATFGAAAGVTGLARHGPRESGACVFGIAVNLLMLPPTLLLAAGWVVGWLM